MNRKKWKTKPTRKQVENYLKFIGDGCKNAYINPDLKPLFIAELKKANLQKTNVPTYFDSDSIRIEKKTNEQKQILNSVYGKKVKEV